MEDDCITQDHTVERGMEFRGSADRDGPRARRLPRATFCIVLPKWCRKWWPILLTIIGKFVSTFRQHDVVSLLKHSKGVGEYEK